MTTAMAPHSNSTINPAQAFIQEIMARNLFEQDAHGNFIQHFSVGTHVGDGDIEAARQFALSLMERFGLEMYVEQRNSTVRFRL